MDEVAKLPFLRPHPRTGMYGFRRPVPQKHWSLFGREFNVSFGIRDRDEATRRWRAEYDRTQRLLDLADAGEYPPLEDEAIEEMVRRWFQQATFPNDGSEFDGSPRGAGFDHSDQLSDSLTPFIRQHLPTIKIGGITFERIRQEAISEHHFEFGGYRGDTERADDARQRVRARDPEQLLQSISKPAVVPTTPITAQRESILLSELATRYLTAKRDMTDTLKGEVRTYIRRLIEVIGDKPIAVITRDDMVTLRETLFAMPARLTVAQRSLPYPKIAATIRADQTTMTTGTIRKWFNMIEAAFHWAVSEQLLNKNPAIGVKPAKDKGQTRDTFSLDDIAIILNSSAVAGNFRPVGGAGEAAKWVPLIALYTGARLTEVGQLLLTDIKVEGAIHYFDFTTLDDDGNAVKTLKNATSRRRVPVHHKIIEAGFLDYLAKLRATRQRYLFPLLPHGKGDPRLVMKPWGKWWGRYSDTLGITSRRKPFHSTRHAFKRACRRAGIGKDVHSELTGHATSDVGDGYGRIDGMAFDLDTLDDAIQLVTYDR